MSAGRVASLIEACERHRRYLDAARRRLPAPLTAEQLLDPSEELVAALDQFAFRFVRLQDLLGARLFRAFLVEVLGEPYEEAPFRDVLNRLETLRLIESAESWESTRAMRNALAHEYPESPADRAAALGLAIAMADGMAKVFQRLRDEAATRAMPRQDGSAGGRPDEASDNPSV